MIKTFTENDLIRYIYGETTELENREIETNEIIDPELGNEIRELKSLVKGLESMIQTPSKSVINKILNYSISRT